MVDLIFKILSLSFVTVILTFFFKYIFMFNFRHDYKKKKFNLIKVNLEKLDKLYNDNYENPSLPPYLIQASVNECLATKRFSYKVIFFLMKNGFFDLELKAKDVEKIWPFTKIVDIEGNKIELRTKYSFEQIKRWNNWCLLGYLFISIFLILSVLFEQFISTWITLDVAMVIVPSAVFIMFILSWFGIKFTSIIVLNKVIKF
ncbi:TPA: hypothetical protein ACIFCU_003735, partial [Acinetobacter baumannii]